ncbi:MAG: hypothetical protein J5691_04800 [Bacilli bacterium]|nr:hypothetical protein [Bacilli bacterium]
MKRIILLFFNTSNIIIITVFLFYISYGYIYVLGFFLPIMMIVDIIAYQNHIRKYPLNSIREYSFDVKKDNFADYNAADNTYVVCIQNDMRVYNVISGEKSMTFNMKGCFFPISFLRAFFVRNIHFEIINRMKMPIRRISSSLRVHRNFKYQNLKIVIMSKKKKKEYWIVKNGRTVVNIIIADIIGNPFQELIFTNTIHHKYNEYIRVSENYYSKFKKK